MKVKQSTLECHWISYRHLIQLLLKRQPLPSLKRLSVHERPQLFRLKRLVAAGRRAADHLERAVRDVHLGTRNDRQRLC